MYKNCTGRKLVTFISMVALLAYVAVFYPSTAVYAVNTTYSGYMIYFRRNGNVAIYKPGGQGLPSEMNCGKDFSSPTHVKIVNTGNNIKVYVDYNATPYIDWTESNNTYSSGYASLVTGHTHSHFDNVAVYGFYDDFAAGSGRWTAIDGSWAVESGEYSQSSTAAYGYNAAITGKTWNDATYEFDMKIIDYAGNDTNWAGIQIKKSNPGDSHASSGYMIYFSKNGNINIYKPGGQGLPATVNSELDFSALTHVKVVSSGNTIKVYAGYNPTPYINWTDTGNTYTSGYASLVTGCTHSHFDDVYI